MAMQVQRPVNIDIDIEGDDCSCQALVARLEALERGKGVSTKGKRAPSAWNQFVKACHERDDVKKLKTFKEKAQKCGQLWQEEKKKRGKAK